MSAAAITPDDLWEGQGTLLSLVLASAAFVFCYTRVLSGNSYRPRVTNGQAVPLLPYWIPFVGHSISLFACPSHFLEQSSHESIYPIFALKFLRRICNIAFAPSMIKHLDEQDSSIVDDGWFRWYSLTNAFGAERTHIQAYLAAQKGAEACLSKSTSKALETTLAAIEENVPNLMSFSENIVYQPLWERISFVPTNPTARDDSAASPSLEISLFPLIQNFVAHITTASLMGNGFHDHHPWFLDDLWDFDHGFKYLLLGFPRWFPIRSLTKAYLARQRLKSEINEFHRALQITKDGGAPAYPWTAIDNISELIKERSDIWREHGVTDSVRGACDLDLLWRTIVPTSKIASWLLLRIWSTPSLIRKVRKEISPFAKASQARQQFIVAELPQLKIDVEGLVESCPLFKACYYECLRLDSTPISIRSVIRDCSLAETHDDTLSSANRATYVLEAGTLVAVPHNAHLIDPRYIDSPRKFQPSRFLVQSESGDGRTITDAGTLRPFGGGESVYLGQDVAERAIMAFVAGFLVLWDLEPVNRSGWVVPGDRAAIGVASPPTDIKVRIQRRKLPP